VSIPFKPNTLTVEPKVLTTDGGNVALTGGYGDAQTITCMAHPENPGTVFEETGLNVVRPYRVFIELSDLAAFPIGSRITNISLGATVIEAGPLFIQSREVFAHGLTTDHADLIAANEA
jgi:hypothetical protein